LSHTISSISSVLTITTPLFSTALPATVTGYTLAFGPVDQCLPAGLAVIATIGEYNQYEPDSVGYEAISETEALGTCAEYCSYVPGCTGFVLYDSASTFGGYKAVVCILYSLLVTWS
jgi:hypothetical protein